MSESKFPFAVGLDEVVDPDAFHKLAIRVELGLLTGEAIEAHAAERS